MSESSDSAEEIVRLSLEGFEVVARLTGSMAKEMAVMLVALSKEKSIKTKGQTRLNNMLKSNSNLRIFTIKKDDYQDFKKQAKRYGVLYTALGKKSEISKDGNIDILVKEGYLVKKQGRGTFVKGTVIRKQLNDVVSFYKSSLLRGEIPTTELHLLELEEPSLFVMKALKITRNKKVWHMKRVRLTDGFPMIFEESYWSYDIVGEITPEIASISVFNHLKHMIKIAYATEDIDAITANEELASLLKTSVGFPLLRTYMVFYTDKDEPFEISTNYHRTDRLKLTLFRTLNE